MESMSKGMRQGGLWQGRAGRMCVGAARAGYGVIGLVERPCLKNGAGRGMIGQELEQMSWV